MEKNTYTSIEIVASDRMMLTDGIHFAKAVLLPAGDDGSKWEEIPIEEAMKRKKQLEAGNK